MAVLTIATAGSVDDGKSTLLGRLLLELGAVPVDVLERWQAAGGDPARLLDGLEDEAAQGITIDVAWLSVDLGGRRLRFADSPGHQQYLRNMATAASHADALMIVVDALRGPSIQSFRHARIAALMGVRRALVVATKMDSVAWQAQAFEAVASRMLPFLAELGVEAEAVAVSGRTGAHIARPAAQSPWAGPTLLDRLARLELAPLLPGAVLPVSWTGRAGARRLVAGRMAGGGRLAAGAKLALWPEGRPAQLAWVDGTAGHRPSLMLGLADELDAPRGTVLASADSGVGAGDAFVVDLAVLGGETLMPGRRYRAIVGTASTGAELIELSHAIEPETGQALAVRAAAPDMLVRASVALDRPVAWRAACRVLGRIVLADAEHGVPLAAGPIAHRLRRAANLRWQETDTTPAARARLLGQRPAIAWLTGLPGSGKSTIANLVDRRLHALGRPSMLLDGDNLRHGLNRDLGFAPEDRVENLRRAAEAAKLLADAGLFVIAAFISPFRADRAAVRRALAPHRMLELFVDTPPEVCEARDPKGLWARARAGEIAQFTGVDQPYEPPHEPDLRIDTTRESAAEAAQRIVERLLTGQP